MRTWDYDELMATYKYVDMDLPATFDTWISVNTVPLPMEGTGLVRKGT